MHILLQTQILTVNWGAIATIFTGIASLISILVYVTNLNKARKADIMEVVTKKADKEQLNTHLEKINSVRQGLEDHKQHNNTQFDSLNDKIDEFHAIQNHVSKRIDEIYKMLSKIAS